MSTSYIIRQCKKMQTLAHNAHIQYDTLMSNQKISKHFNKVIYINKEQKWPQHAALRYPAAHTTKWRTFVSDFDCLCSIRRGHNRHGPKRGGGAAVPFRGSWDPRLVQCGLGRGLLPYQAASFIHSIQPFGHNRHGPKWGGVGVPFFWGYSWVHIEHSLT